MDFYFVANSHQHAETRTAQDLMLVGLGIRQVLLVLMSVWLLYMVCLTTLHGLSDYSTWSVCTHSIPFTLYVCCTRSGHLLMVILFQFCSSDSGIVCGTQLSSLLWVWVVCFVRYFVDLSSLCLDTGVLFTVYWSLLASFVKVFVCLLWVIYRSLFTADL